MCGSVGDGHRLPIRSLVSGCPRYNNHMEDGNIRHTTFLVVGCLGRIA